LGPEPDLRSKVPGMHIWGWMLPAELRWLMREAARMESVVEVGSLHGRSAFAMLTVCKGPVYCIDPWDDVHGKCYPSFMGYCGHFPNLRAIQAFSPAAMPDVIEMNGGPVEMVFIDGNHDYEQVISDIDGWLPNTTKLICGHDYQADDGNWPDVAVAVHERFGRDGITVARGTSIWAVRL
jgi:hypothetical protein